MNYERQFETRYEGVTFRIHYNDHTVDEECYIFFQDGQDEVTHLLADEVVNDLLIEAQVDYTEKYEELDFFDRADIEHELRFEK